VFIAGACVALAAAAATPSPSRSPLDTGAAVDRILGEVNTFRQQQGRAALAANPQLTAAAQDFAAYIARTHRFSHEADGREPPDRAQAHGYAYCIVDENIGYEQRNPDFNANELASRLVQGWEASPPHRRNMLDPDVRDTGIGLAQDASTGRWYGVQMFGAPQSARATFEVVNEAGSAVRYRLGDRQFDLAPRATRTHQECRPASLALDGGNPPAVQPRNGGRYRVVRDQSGSLRLATD
jgi:uncharacterized protein YkwD